MATLIIAHFWKIHKLYCIQYIVYIVLYFSHKTSLIFTNICAVPCLLIGSVSTQSTVGLRCFLCTSTVLHPIRTWYTTYNLSTTTNAPPRSSVCLGLRLLCPCRLKSHTQSPFGGTLAPVLKPLLLILLLLSPLMSSRYLMQRRHLQYEGWRWNHLCELMTSCSLQYCRWCCSKFLDIFRKKIIHHSVSTV